MSLYPLFANLVGRRVLVVGGGSVGERKVLALHRAGALVEVGAPRITSALVRLVESGQITHRNGLFEDNWLDEDWLVIAATGDRVVNRQIAASAEARRLFVNVVDDAELSTFQVPAVVDRSPLTIAISTAGVLETRDSGETWRGRNRGMLNDYLPDPNAEWGHDAHFVTLSKGQPDHVWQQNHTGVFYSADGAENWKRVSQAEVGVHFGFPIAADDEDGRTAWVVPGKADSARMAIEGALFVARTRDGGESWEQLREGMPQENAFDVVYRHALANAGECLAFGSTTGNLYVSEDRGDRWETVANNLPPIYSVRFG